MGLFDLFKKKRTTKETDIQTRVTVKITSSTEKESTSDSEQSPVKKQRNANNDYANAVFLNFHRNKKCTNESMSHLGWPAYKLGIHDTAKKFQSLLREGYFEEVSPEEQLCKLKVEELKTIITRNGLIAKGKKSDLVNIVIESIPIETLGLKKLYKLSAKGVDFIDDHQDLIQLFKNPYKITYKEYLEVKNDAPSYFKYNDIIWSVFIHRELKFSATDNLSRRFNAFYRAEFLKNEGKYVTALLEYLTVAYYDIEEKLETFDYVPLSQWRKDKLTPPETELSSQLVDVIYELREYYQSDLPSDAIKRSNITKKHLSAMQYTNYIETLLKSKESDFSRYVRK